MLDLLTGKRLMPWRRTFLRKFCRAVLPGPAEGFPDPVEAGVVEQIERYVAGLHPLLRLGLMGLFDALNLLAVFFGYLRPMSWLPEASIRRYLHRLEGSSVYLVRNLFTAGKALCMTVFYSEPSVERATGYSDECLA